MLIFAIAKGREPVAKLPSFFSVPAFGVSGPGLGFSRPTPGFSKPSVGFSKPSVENFSRRVVAASPGFENPVPSSEKSGRCSVWIFGAKVAQES